jgi:hypothetical protein
LLHALTSFGKRGIARQLQRRPRRRGCRGCRRHRCAASWLLLRREAADAGRRFNFANSGAIDGHRAAKKEPS